MKILVFGAGALGQAIGCLLAADNHAVDIILRERFIVKIRDSGLSVTGIFGDYHAAPERLGLYPAVDDLPAEPYDYALVTTKSYDTETACAELARLPDQTFTAVSLQNGCGNLEVLVSRFGERHALGGRVITGFEIERPGLVRITVTADDIHIGGYTEGDIHAAATRIADALAKAGLPCVTTPFLRRDLLAKLLYNCALNPLGALLGVHYGVLGDSSQSREVMDTVIGEVFSVIEAMGESTHWNSAAEYREFFYEHQIPATYDHRPSMLQDLENGKRTEVDALTGYVSAQGRRHRVPTPVCDTLTALIHFQETMSEKTEPSEDEESSPPRREG